MYLGSDTTLVSPGASPVTLTPGGWGVEFSLLRALQVSICLDTLYICFTNTLGVHRAHPGSFCAIFDLPRWGDQNRKNRDCTRTRHAIGPRFGVLILMPTFVGFAPLPRSRVHICLFGNGGRVSTHILLPHLVRSPQPLDALLTCFTGYI